MRPISSTRTASASCPTAVQSRSYSSRLSRAAPETTATHSQVSRGASPSAAYSRSLSRHGRRARAVRAGGTVVPDYWAPTLEEILTTTIFRERRVLRVDCSGRGRVPPDGGITGAQPARAPARSQTTDGEKSVPETQTGACICGSVTGWRRRLVTSSGRDPGPDRTRVAVVPAARRSSRPSHPTAVVATVGGECE